MRLLGCIAQTTFSLALAVSPLTSQTAPSDLAAQAAFGAQSWLGVGIVDITPAKAQELGLDTTHGVEIAQIAEGGPADEAGLERHDIVTRFRDEKVLGAEHLARLVRETPIGRSVKLEVWRDGERQELNVVVQQRGAPAVSQILERFQTPRFGAGFDIPRPIMAVSNRALGLEVEAIDDQLAQYFGVQAGLLVRSVEDDSPADEAGMTAGDVIVRVEGQSVKTPTDLRREIQEAESPVQVVVMRNRRERTLTLPEEDSDSRPLSLTDRSDWTWPR